VNVSRDRTDLPKHETEIAHETLPISNSNREKKEKTQRETQTDDLNVFNNLIIGEKDGLRDDGERRKRCTN